MGRAMWWCCRRPEGLILLLLALPAVLPARAEERVGPSFACAQARDPLPRLVCDDPALARADLALVQVYQALLQSLPENARGALREENTAFARRLRADCPVPADKPETAADCVATAYARQRQVWAGRLSGAAKEEAARPLEQHLALQHDMQALGLLAPEQEIDGIYGFTTRGAIVGFQLVTGLEPTGLLGAEDARRLAAVARPGEKPAAPVTGSAVTDPAVWERFRSEALAEGVRASARFEGETCRVALDVTQPEALLHALPAESREKGTAVPLARMAEFLRTTVAARAVQALYASAPEADRCTFSAAAFTADIYGRDVRQALFDFTFERATYERIVWDRFDPANLPTVAMNFAWGDYARAQLPQAQPAPVVPVPAAAPPPAPQPRVERAALPAEPEGRALERRFVAALAEAGVAYEGAPNDLARGAARLRRAHVLCALMERREATDWVGEVATLSSSSEGKGVLVVRIAPHATLGTTTNSLSDGLAPLRTLIDDSSPVLEAALALKPGQRVVFSGRFAPSEADCLFEQSLTQAGSMREPAFLFRFTALRAEEGP